jgi:hypothetical protein
MTDTIQSRIREYLAGENDECHRKLLTQAANALDKAERSLRAAGYTDEGGEYWKPPLGKPPRILYSSPQEAWGNPGDIFLDIKAGFQPWPADAWPKR